MLSQTYQKTNIYIYIKLPKNYQKTKFVLFLIKNHGGQRWWNNNFQVLKKKKKELSTQSSRSNRKVLEEWWQIKAFSADGKLEELGTSRPVLKEVLMETLKDEENDSKGKHGTTEIKRQKWQI